MFLPYWNIANKTETQSLLNDITFLGGNGSDQFPYLLPNNSMLSCDKFKIDHNLNGRKQEYNYSCLSRTIGVGRLIHDGNILIAAELPFYDEWNELLHNYVPYDVAPYNTAYDNFTQYHHLNSFRSLLDGCTKWIDNETIPDLVTAVKNGACPAKLHGNAHVYIGGQLASGSSPNDPLFFLLHAFVDLMWARYQDKYGDDSFPSHLFGDVKLFDDKQFIGNNHWTSDDIMDHRNQLNYIYDIQVKKDVSMKTTKISSVDAENEENDGIIIGSVIGGIFAILLIILVIFTALDKSKRYHSMQTEETDVS